MNEYEFQKISLDVAYAFEMDEDDIMEAFHEGDIKVFDDKDEAFYWLYIDDEEKGQLRETILEMGDIDSIDLEGYTSVKHYMLANDDRIYFVEDSEKVVFLYE